MPARYDFYGSLNVDAMSKAFRALLARHTALRQRYVAVAAPASLADRVAGGAAVRAVTVSLDTAMERAWHVESLSSSSSSSSDDIDNVDVAIEQRAQQAASYAFDLEAGPPVRATLLTVSAERHVLLLTLHHIAGDGASFGVIERDLKRLYETALRQPTLELATALTPLDYQYIDYAHWQREAIAPLLADQLAYWRSMLADDLSPIELPYDRPHPATSAFRAASVDISIKPALAERLRHLARSAGATMFVFLFLFGFCCVFYFKNILNSHL
jgi:hypothetical protein